MAIIIALIIYLTWQKWEFVAACADKAVSYRGGIELSMWRKIDPKCKLKDNPYNWYPEKEKKVEA